MQYHIQTTPIWDSFKSDCDCPICALYKTTEQRLVKQYLGEAVMEPDYRVRVNKRGFCDRHLLALYNGDNKLGTALQVCTRTEYVEQSIQNITKAKQASGLAEDLAETLNTCVICDTADEIMYRYTYTVAQMYDNEPEFPELFSASKGFCMPHFVDLLRHVKMAGKSADKYLAALIAVQKRSLNRTVSDLEKFTQKFDYRNAGSISDKYDNALPKAIKKLKGDILTDK